MTKELKSFDFAAAFVTIDSQEQGAEFEVLKDDGSPSGFFITLAGPDSAKRKKLASKAQRLVLGAIDADGKVKEDEADRVDGEYDVTRMEEMVAGTVAWRYPEGFEGPECTPENVRALYQKHPTIYRQVLTRAGDLSRFTKR